MKIHIDILEQADDLEITVSCPRLTPEVERVVAMLRVLDQKLTGSRDGEIHLLDASDVLYIESVDGKCFLYTASDVFESPLHMYELEKELETCEFFRISRFALVNLRWVTSLRTDINRKIRITMKNGEQLVASRQYADALKKKLKVR